MFHILAADPISTEGLSVLQHDPNVTVTDETGLSPDELENRIDQFDALLVRSQTKVTRSVIEKASRLKIIGRAGVGVDNIDLDAATEHGVLVVNAPNGNTNSAAEHTMAMTMALSRQIPQAHLSLQNGKWDRKKYVGFELKGKKLGIIGLGRIGTEVAYRAKGQRMDVIAYDPFFTEEKADQMGIEYGTLEDVFQEADYITVHTPLLKDTHHMINADAFSKMKDGVHIMNCARGGIIEEDALYDAIVSGKVAGAAIDVLEDEPFQDHKLLQLPQVIATPHLGASTVEAQENVAIDVCRDIINHLTGEMAQNPVNMPSVPSDVLSQIEPYFHLADKLGTFLIHLTEDVPEEVNVYYSGELSDVKMAPITRNAVKGLLQRHLGSHVNDVNALYLAEQKGITINESRTATTKGFTNLLTVEVKTNSGARSVSGTLLNGLGPRIVRVDQYSVDVVPQGHLVIIHHKDLPGVIGNMGSLLSQYHVNIATMQVDRSNVGGDAIMILTVDKFLDKDEMTALKQLEEISDVTAVDL
ncbi:phosphoglycerate dehydrogenase [Lentibacillus halophilus]|uniref:D-3-phosphoglycerate dehydrogenase n=1 Tax=Lentibacillus halophilus TaxID=295065 RepID=A0ABN0Z9J4_9BACI